MIYFGKIGNTQTRTFVDAELKDFAKTYPNIDLFTVDQSEINLIADQIENDRVIIYYTDEPPNDGLNVFFNLFNRYPEKTFCMLGDIPLWRDLAQWPKNVQWIYYSFSLYSYDPQNHIGEYRNIDCFTDKNFDSEKIGISLNRLPRSHRLGSMSYMLGIGLDQECVITSPLLAWYLETSNTSDIMDVVPWDFSKHNNFKECMLNGWERAKAGDGLFPVTVDAYPPYDDLRPLEKVFANADNLKNNLLSFYNNSFVEFVNVNVFQYPLPWICEKMLNSQLACNFPIWIAGKGTVEWLRNQDFDVFDDVINHAYDLESDPVLRIQTCISDNRTLLQNQNYTKDLWIKHHHRFRHNVDWHIEKSDNTVIKGRKLLANWIKSDLYTKTA